jgi:pimeloyl-ACP methyl ester carboxylesterase
MERFGNAGYSFEVTDTPSAGGGGGRQVALLLHGFPEDRHSWDGVASALAAAGYRVLAPDQRGYSPGARPAARSAYTLSRLAGDVLALADAAGVQRFHLVGHDWGGALAWYVADHYPGRLISLAALSVPHPQAFLRALASSNQAARSWYMAAFQLPGLPELVLSRRGGEAMRAALVHSGLDPGTAARYASRAADRPALRGPLNWYRAIPLGLRERTGRIEVPTLFMWSDGDRFVSQAAAELCGRYVSGHYRFEVIEGASHWLPEEAPERVAASLVAHFARTSGG